MEFHNRVNDQTGKRRFTRDELDAKYRDANLHRIYMTFLQIYTMSDGNTYNGLMNSMAKQRMLSQIKNWVNQNHTKYNS